MEDFLKETVSSEDITVSRLMEIGANWIKWLRVSCLLSAKWKSRSLRLISAYVDEALDYQLYAIILSEHDVENLCLLRQKIEALCLRRTSQNANWVHSETKTCEKSFGNRKQKNESFELSFSSTAFHHPILNVHDEREPFHSLLQNFEKKYNKELNDNGGKCSPQTTFEYAWSLVRSSYSADIKKVQFSNSNIRTQKLIVDVSQGISLLETLVESHSEGNRDYIYYLAFGNARIKEYGIALKFCKAFLQVEPTNQQAMALEVGVHRLFSQVWLPILILLLLRPFAGAHSEENGPGGRARRGRGWRSGSGARSDRWTGSGVRLTKVG